MVKEVEFWDKAARKLLKLKPPEWFSRYIGISYRRAIELGLKCIKLDKKIKLLKTDLWNEGIEYQRDILGHYQNYKNLDLYGIDISSVVCSYAKSRVKNIHILQADFRDLPFKSESFDIIIDLSTLDHIPESQVKNVIREYKRVLKKNGVLVLIFWYKSFLVRIKMIRRRQENDMQYYFSLKLIKSIVESAFNIKKEYCTGLILCIPGLGFIINKLPMRIRNWIIDNTIKLEYSKLSKFIFKNFAALYVVIGTKREG